VAKPFGQTKSKKISCEKEGTGSYFSEGVWRTIPTGAQKEREILRVQRGASSAGVFKEASAAKKSGRELSPWGPMGIRLFKRGGIAA